MEKKEKNKFSRRDFAKIVGGLGLSYLTYRLIDFNVPVSGVKAKIVIVGAGAAGISMASRLQRALSHPEITIIDPNDVHFYQPGFTLIGAGIYKGNDVFKKQSSLIPGGVKWIKDSVKEFSPDNNTLTTSKNENISYDFLVLCPGLQMNFDAIEGISRDTLGLGNAHSIYDFQGAQKTWEAIQELSEKGGKALFTDTWTKIKCGGAPKKINMITEDYCRKQGSRDKVDIKFVSASHEMYDVPIYRKRLEAIYTERNIPITYNTRIKSVDTSAKMVTFEKQVKTIVEINNPETNDIRKEEQIVLQTEQQHYDFLHIVPPMKAPTAIIESPLSWNAKTEKHEDWVPTDKYTLVHAQYQNIVVLGDVSNLPTSKTGAAVRIQVPIAVSNLIALMEQKAPSKIYNGYSACPYVTEYGKVLMAEFGYGKQPIPSLPFIDPGVEHWIWWFMKVYMLKPMYFHGMLKGLI
ncbi:pyridine nucleotide-disulfide oxidoreductase [Bacteroidales bacterium]|nr:pyridine nucleotide-disulfide oxidoreductase [Bacteroidales bacterium]